MSTTKGYIMAKNNVQSVSHLLCTQVIKPQISQKPQNQSWHKNIENIHEHQTEKFRRISPFGMAYYLFCANAKQEAGENYEWPTPDCAYLMCNEGLWESFFLTNKSLVNNSNENKLEVKVDLSSNENTQEVNVGSQFKRKQIASKSGFKRHSSNENKLQVTIWLTVQTKSKYK